MHRLMNLRPPRARRLHVIAALTMSETRADDAYVQPAGDRVNLIKLLLEFYACFYNLNSIVWAFRCVLQVRIFKRRTRVMMTGICYDFRVKITRH